jgi:SAM-dependent methyltransferase
VNALNRLKRYYVRQMFFPNGIGLLVNPFYFARSALVAGIAEFAPGLHGRLLDVGCGTKPYRELFTVDEYLGLDIDNSRTRETACADYYYSGGEFPVSDNSFDVVLCNQVLEHVFNPDEFLAEIIRVLKPGGKLLLTVPFVWDEHEQPHDYARYTTFGLRHLLERQSLRLLQQRKLCADASILFQLINVYLFKVSATLPRLVFASVILPLMALSNVSGWLVSKLLPRNPDLFLDQLILAEKVA